MICSSPDFFGRSVHVGEGRPVRTSEQRDDAAGVGGCAAVVVAFLPEAADVVCYVAGEALIWVVLAGNSWGRAGRAGP